MSKTTNTTITYKSGPHPTEQWEWLQVIYQHEEPATGAKQTGDSFVIARAPDGSILRKTDIVLERWELITDEDDLRFFRSHFRDNDKLTMERNSL